MLSVHVDGLKMAGRTKDLTKAWGAIRGAAEEPGYNWMNQFLLHTTKITKDEPQQRLQQIADLLLGSETQPCRDQVQHDIKSIVYDMQGFIDQCVDRHCELARVGKDSLTAVPTPSLDDHQIDPSGWKLKAD